MSPFDPTRASLLLRIRDPRDDQAWRQFIEIYEPLVRSYCRKRGLQDADAADVTQEVLQAVAGAVERFQYDPARGSFRSWLLNVTHHKLGHYFSKEKRQPRGSGETAVQKLLESTPTLDDTREWDREYKRRVFDWATESIRNEFRETTWRAFELTTHESLSGEEAAAQLGLSTTAVYQAKSRIVARLRERVREITEAE